MPVQKRISAGLNIPLAQIYGVVTFYSFFTMTPRGKHTVRVCLGTACYVRGGKTIAESLVKQFGVEEGGTTEDRMFTYETVRCLGACGLGTVVVVDEECPMERLNLPRSKKCSQNTINDEGSKHGKDQD